MGISDSQDTAFQPKRHGANALYSTGSPAEAACQSKLRAIRSALRPGPACDPRGVSLRNLALPDDHSSLTEARTFPKTMHGEWLQRRFLEQSMGVFPIIQGKCAHVGAISGQVSGHLPVQSFEFADSCQNVSKKTLGMLPKRCTRMMPKCFQMLPNCYQNMHFSMLFYKACSGSHRGVIWESRGQCPGIQMQSLRGQLLSKPGF